MACSPIHQSSTGKRNVSARLCGETSLPAYPVTCKVATRVPNHHPPEVSHLLLDALSPIGDVACRQIIHALVLLLKNRVQVRIAAAETQPPPLAKSHLISSRRRAENTSSQTTRTPVGLLSEKDTNLALAGFFISHLTSLKLVRASRRRYTSLCNIALSWVLTLVGARGGAMRSNQQGGAAKLAGYITTGMPRLTSYGLCRLGGNSARKPSKLMLSPSNEKHWPSSVYS